MSTKDRVNILMVDDQPAKLLSYEAILGELDENLVKATSGREALEYLLKMDVAVVLMDVSMPEIDGFELASMIRQHPRFHRTAIIFVSAVHLTDLDRLKGYERGAVDYISVPVIPELLRAKVSVFAELHRKAQQLWKLNRELEVRVADRTQELEHKAEALELLNAQLNRKNEQLDAILQTAPDIIFSSQGDGFRDYMSDRFFEFTGSEPNVANGHGWMDYVHPEDREATDGRWKLCMSSGEHYEAEYRMRGRHGEYRWFRARAIPIRDHEGTIVRWYGTCSDIQDSKLLEQSIRENAATLEKVVEERTEALRQLSSRLMRMQDEERRRIARELHDSTGQKLAALQMNMSMVKSTIPTPPPEFDEIFSECASLARSVSEELRTLSYLLHPPLLDECGLNMAIDLYVSGINQRHGLHVQVEMPQALCRLSEEAELAIFRVVQASLTNVHLHSGATEAKVMVHQNLDGVVVAIVDEGQGIPDGVLDHSSRTRTIGIGITGMRERVEQLGGRFEIESNRNGTRVKATIPSRHFRTVTSMQ